MIEQDDFQFEREHETIYDNVKRLVERYPVAHESYTVLDAFYWYYVDKLFEYIPLSRLLKLTSPESINRAYRKVLEDNPHLAPSPKTVRRRRAQVDRFAKFYRRKEEEEYRRLMR